MAETQDNTTDGDKEQIPLLAPATDDSKTNEESAGKRYTRQSHGDSGFIHDMLQHDHPTKHYSIWVAMCFAVNFSVGSGVLGLPNEYVEAGYVLGTLILMLCGFLTYVTYIYVANLVYRAEVITKLCVARNMPKSEIKDNPNGILMHLTNNNTQTVSNDEIQQAYVDFYRNEYELNHLIGVFCGRWTRYLYEFCWVISKVVALWSYNTLFAASLARNVGIPGISDACNIEHSGYTEDCRALYSFYVCIFVIWCTMISLLDFTEQAGLQIAGAIMRFGIIMIMCITSIGLMYGNLYYDGDAFEEYSGSYSTPHYGDGVGAWKWDGLLYFLAVSNFAFSAQFAVPDVIEPLKHDDRSRQPFLWRTVMFALLFIYCFSGLTISLYFGDEVEDPCSLAWKYYRGFDWTDSRPIGSYIISWIILLLPPMDMLTAFPLHCITLANTIEQSILKEAGINSASNTESEMSDNDDVNSVASSVNYFIQRWNDFRSQPLRFRYRAILRVCIIILCAGLALLSWNFDFVIILSGTFGLISLNFLPAYAEMKSRKMFDQISNNDTTYKTPATDFSSYNVWVYATMAVAVIATIGVFVELGTDY